jgi:hypothetical protein
VLLETFLLDDLLRRDVADCEQHRRCDALRQQRPRREFPRVPENCLAHGLYVSQTIFSFQPKFRVNVR